MRKAELIIGSQANNLRSFRDLRRNHSAPYYRIPGIHPSGPVEEPVEPVPLPPSLPQPDMPTSPQRASEDLNNFAEEDEPEKVCEFTRSVF